MSRGRIIMVGLVVLLAALLIIAGVGFIWARRIKQSSVQTPTSITCGGIAGIHCPKGYTCSYPPQANYPDAAGHCILKE